MATFSHSKREGAGGGGVPFSTELTEKIIRIGHHKFLLNVWLS